MTVSHGDVLRVSANFILPDGSLYQNIYHWLFDGVGSPADADVVDDIDAHLGLAYDEIESYVQNTVLNDLSFVDEVQFLDGEWQVTRNVGTFTLAMAGIGAGDALPNQASAFVTFKTARPKSVGRKFLFPIIESAQAEGYMGGPPVTAIVAYAAIILDDITVDVINALHPGVVRTGVDDWLSFTAAVVTNLIGTQRRRRPGYGA